MIDHLLSPAPFSSSCYARFLYILPLQQICRFYLWQIYHLEITVISQKYEFFISEVDKCKLPKNSNRYQISDFKSDHFTLVSLLH